MRPDGVNNQRISLLYTGQDAAAVISHIEDNQFKPNPSDMLRHEEAITRIFTRQVILPAKFPKILSLDALERSMADMDRDLNMVLRRIIYKSEYQIKIFMTDPAREDNGGGFMYNAFSRFVMENASRFKYKHYFPLLSREAKEAEFVDYAETVVKHISQQLCAQTTYWRGKSFQSEKVLMESFFWVRKHRSREFETVVEKLRSFYPNLRFSLLGPTPPYNFVQLDFAENI